MMFAAGASLSLVLFLVLPHPEANVPGMLATIAVTFAVTAWVIVRGDRIPQGAYPWLVALGTVLITLGIFFRGEPTAPHALFYLWIVFYSCYFLGRAAAFGELVLALAGYGLVLALADEATGEALELWLVAACGLLVSGRADHDAEGAGRRHGLAARRRRPHRPAHRPAQPARVRGDVRAGGRARAGAATGP